MGVKEEGQLRSEAVDIQPGIDGSLDVSYPIGKGESHLLNGG